MLRSVDELRNLLSAASRQQSQLETQLEEQASQHRNVLVERDEVIREQRTQLETCEEQLQLVTRRGQSVCVPCLCVL